MIGHALEVMLFGMLGIFIVMIMIIGMVNILSHFGGKDEK